MFKTLKNKIISSLMLGGLALGLTSMPAIIQAQEPVPANAGETQTIRVWKDLDGQAYTGDAFTVSVTDKNTGQSIGNITHFENGVGTLEIARGDADYTVVVAEVSNPDDKYNYDDTTFDVVIAKKAWTQLAGGESVNRRLHALEDNAGQNITSFARSANAPEEGTYTVNLSVPAATAPITAWFDSGTAYWYCTLPQVPTTDYGSMFADLRGLKNVSFDGLQLPTAGYSTALMFWNCSALESITFPAGFGANATEMHQMFLNCSSLQSIALPEGFGSSATRLDTMFYDCSALESITLPAGFGANATKINELFYNCNSLQTINVPEGTDFSSVGEMGSMFVNCNSLVGGSGTAYDSNYTDGTYAHIDGGVDNPGYFTQLP